MSEKVGIGKVANDMWINGARDLLVIAEFCTYLLEWIAVCGDKLKLMKMITVGILVTGYTSSLSLPLIILFIIR